MSEDFHSVWKSLIDRTTNFVCRDFPDVDREDMRQELFLFVWTNRSRLVNPDQQGSVGAIQRAAKIFAWDQRKQHLSLSSQYSYRTSDVRHILETVFDSRDWDSVRVPDDAKSEFNDVFLEINSDVKRAWESLGHAQKVIIFEKFALGNAPEDAAGRKRLQRAIEALTDSLNWYQRPRDHDFVGTRRVITNANARANISKLSDEE